MHRYGILMNLHVLCFCISSLCKQFIHLGVLCQGRVAGKEECPATCSRVEAESVETHECTFVDPLLLHIRTSYYD